MMHGQPDEAYLKQQAEIEAWQHARKAARKNSVRNAGSGKAAARGKEEPDRCPV